MLIDRAIPSLDYGKGCKCQLMFAVTFELPILAFPAQFYFSGKLIDLKCMTLRNTRSERDMRKFCSWFLGSCSGILFRLHSF